jgi:hypothetical protein
MWPRLISPGLLLITEILTYDQPAARLLLFNTKTFSSNPVKEVSIGQLIKITLFPKNLHTQVSGHYLRLPGN